MSNFTRAVTTLICLVLSYSLWDIPGERLAASAFLVAGVIGALCSLVGEPWND